MKEYKLTLSQKDFNDMADRIKNLQKKLPVVVDKILERLAEYSKERIQFYIKESVNEEYATGHLESNVEISDIKNHIVSIYISKKEVPYVFFVEYGTGIVGSENPHPDYEGNYKTEGWWYPTDANDPNPKKRQLPNGDWIVYTQGQKAHKFIYNAFQDLKQNYLTIGRQVLKEEGIV